MGGRSQQRIIGILGAALPIDCPLVISWWTPTTNAQISTQPHLSCGCTIKSLRPSEHDTRPGMPPPESKAEGYSLRRESKFLSFETAVIQIQAQWNISRGHRESNWICEQRQEHTNGLAERSTIVEVRVFGRITKRVFVWGIHYPE